MKKIIFSIMTVMLFASSFVATTMKTSENSQLQYMRQTTNIDFTHNVFIEEATATWCQYCPYAAEALYSLYNNSDYSFYYVALVSDVNPVAMDRMWKNHKVGGIPTIIIDGGFRNFVGSADTVEQVEQAYRPLIEEAGTKKIHPLELETSIFGHGDATFDITVTVKNNGSKPYFGFVTSFVTEITSRWKDNNSDPYHFGFLDYGVKSKVFLKPEQSRTFTMTWNGAATPGNLSFPDIVDNNIMLITTVAHWMPHLITEPGMGIHFGFYVDQSDGASVT